MAKPKKLVRRPTAKEMQRLEFHIENVSERITGLMLAVQGFASDFARVSLERVDLEKRLLADMAQVLKQVDWFGKAMVLDFDALGDQINENTVSLCRLVDEIAQNNIKLEELAAGLRLCREEPTLSQVEPLVRV